MGRAGRAGPFPGGPDAAASKVSAGTAPPGADLQPLGLASPKAPLPRRRLWEGGVCGRPGRIKRPDSSIGREGTAQMEKGPATSTLHLLQGAGVRPQLKGEQEAQAMAFEDQPPPATTHPASQGDRTLSLYR